MRKQNCAFVRKKRFWIHSRGNRSSSSSSRSSSQMRERKGHIQMEETKSCREKRQSIAKDFFYYIGIIVRVQTRPLGRTTTGIIHHPSSIIHHPSSIINPVEIVIIDQFVKEIGVDCIIVTIHSVSKIIVLYPCRTSDVDSSLSRSSVVVQYCNSQYL